MLYRSPCLLAVSLLWSFLSVSAQNIQKGDYGYLYCHMSDLGEYTAYALSRDGLHWHDLAGGRAVMPTETVSPIEGGSRDAYVCRRSDGSEGFLMAVTDMCVRKSKVWNNHGIDLLTSDDLIHWHSTAFDFRTGDSIFCDPGSPSLYADWSKVCRVWAPQICWDPNYVWPDGQTGGYFIYYSIWSTYPNDTHDRMVYSYADRSFTRLTKPRVWFDWGYATIDADINYLASDGMFHLLIKKEGGHPGIFQTKAPALAGPWPEPDEADFVSFEGQKKCEGPSAFQLAGEDGWRVGYIQYSDRPKHYRICRADAYLTGFRDPQDIEGVTAPQHGSFMRLTEEEYHRLEDYFGTEQPAPGQTTH